MEYSSSLVVQDFVHQQYYSFFHVFPVGELLSPEQDTFGGNPMTLSISCEHAWTSQKRTRQQLKA